MKRILLVLTLFVSSIFCFGQDLKDDSEWTRLIDFVCSRYVQSFIDQRCKENLPQTDIDKYNANIRSHLDGKKIGQALDYQNLQGLLQENGFKKAIDVVVTPLFSKYNIDASSRTIDSALDLNVFDDEVSKKLLGARDSLKQELQNHYDNARPKEPDQSSYSSKKDSPRPRPAPTTGWLILFLVELLLLIGLFALLLLRTSEKRIKGLVYNSRSLEDKFILRSEQEVYTQKQQTFKKRLDDIDAAFCEFKEQSAQITKSEYRQHTEAATYSRPSFSPIYVKNFGDGLLRVVDLADAQYQLDLKDESNAQFSFCGDVSKALANSDGTFDYVCEYEGSIADAKRIRTTVPGSATRLPEGKWRVNVKAKIVFE